MVTDASNPARAAPKASTAEPVYSRERSTGLVTPAMVRSPVTTKSLPSALTDVEVKDQVGLTSVEKKSALWRWASRLASPVLRAVASRTAVTDELSTSSPMTIVPSVTGTVPRTLEMPAWRTVNPACVCEPSMV